MKLGVRLTQLLPFAKKVKINGYKVQTSLDGVEWDPENDLREKFYKINTTFGEMEWIFSDSLGLIDRQSVNLAKKIVEVMKGAKNHTVIFTISDDGENIESIDLA